MITMSVTKLLALVVISGLIVVCSCNGAGVQETGPRTDEMPVYKNHRTSKNDTVQVRHKYPAQVYANLYANLSNAMDFTTPAKMIVTESLLQQSKTTEVPTDVVRMFITPSGGSGVKKRPAVDRTTPAAQVQSAVAATSAFKVAAAPSVYFVTARNVQENSTPPPPAQKMPVYSPPSVGSISTAAVGKETADFRVMAAPPTTVTVNEPRRKLKLNGTKIRRLLKAQQRIQQAGQPTVLLSATTTTTTSTTSTTTTTSPPKLQQQHQQVIIGTNMVAQSRNTTAAAAATYAVATKVANSSGASKPFATVLVPKQILEGSSNLAQQDYAPRDDYTSSFRPIAAPVYASYKPAVDANAIVVENRRTSSASKTQAGVSKGQVSSSKAQAGASKVQVGASKAHVSSNKAQVSASKAQVGSSKAQVTAGSVVQTAPKLTKYGFVSLQQPTYKVEEYVPGDVHPSAVQYDKRFNGDGGYKKDRSEQLIFVSAERSQEPAASKPKSDQSLVAAERRVQQLVDHVKYDPSNGQEIITPKPDLKYGFAMPESYDYERQQPFKSGPPANVQLQQQQFREYYPATEVAPTAKDEVASYLKYNSAGKFDVRAASDEMTAGPPYEMDEMPQSGPPYAMDDRPPSSGPPKEYVSGPSATRFSAGEDSSAPEIMLGNVNPKDVLKSLLADMLKTKQQSETTKSSSKPSSVDETIDSYFKTIKSSADNFDIETDMSCSLKSTKYITDGQCVTTKPIVEAVCADRCLVYASSQKLPFSPQRQRSASSANQQVEALHCVNGDVKLMRVQLHCRDGNTLNNVIKVVTNCRCKLHQIQPQVRSNHQSTQQGMGMPNPDIMNIAKGSF